MTILQWNNKLWNNADWAGEDHLAELQKRSVLFPWRRIEIRRRTTDGYESDWLDVSNFVTQWPTISFELDTTNPFTYRKGVANVIFRNDEKQFSQETRPESIFGAFLTRYKTLCRISTGLQDTDDNQFPLTATVFYGVFSDNIIDTEFETEITVNSIAQVLEEFQTSDIAGSIVGVALTSAEILGTIRDHRDSNNNVVLDSFISSGAWILSNTGRTYTIPTTTFLEGLSAFSLIEQLALAENHTFFIDASGNFRFTDRTATTTAALGFQGILGPGNVEINVVSVDEFNEGINRLFTKFSCEILSGTVSTQESFTVGDNSSSWRYGQREFVFSSEFANTATAGSICSDLLSEFSTPRNEVKLTTKYITNLQIKNRVNVNYVGVSGGDNALWDQAIWDVGLWSDPKGGLSIDGDYNVIGYEIDMENWISRFHLREI